MLATDARQLTRDVEMERRGREQVMSEQNGSSGSDDVLSALNELEVVLRENAESERMLFQRISEVRLARENGKEWKSILAGEDEPGTIQLVSTVLRRQSEASGYLRRSLVVALRAEGQSIPSIANLFGVTHQRVSNLLRRVAQGRRKPTDDSDLALAGEPGQHGVGFVDDAVDDVADRW
jgi:hypothetical protein